MNEKPDVRYGRFTEAAYFTGYTFERACRHLMWLLEEERWKQVGPGYTDIKDFLQTIDLSSFNIPVQARQALVARLTELHASQRPIAKAIGVAQDTVRQDLRERNRSAESPSPTRDTPQDERNRSPEELKRIQEAEDYEQHLRLATDRLVKLSIGWVELVTLPDNPEREILLDRLTDTARHKVLEIEAI
jgi:predicted transcriptional regulator